jgi:hypothetical protein
MVGVVGEIERKTKKKGLHLIIAWNLAHSRIQSHCCLLVFITSSRHQRYNISDNLAFSTRRNSRQPWSGLCQKIIGLLCRHTFKYLRRSALVLRLNNFMMSIFIISLSRDNSRIYLQVYIYLFFNKRCTEETCRVSPISGPNLDTQHQSFRFS